MSRRRLAAATALTLGLAALVLGAGLAIDAFPRGVLGLLGIVVAFAAAWQGLLRRGAARVLGLGAGVVLAASVGTLLIPRDPLLAGVALGALWLSLAAARAGFRIHVPLAAAPRPQRPVLFYNPRSGGGKAEQLHLPAQALARGIQPVELTQEADLESLARDAVTDRADALAMAGGDGSQAVVAKVAAEAGLPYACIPAGTRNHFALDLGVDRDDVVGALDALVDGGERVVDLGEVNGHVFVNNVSLGVYADAVQQPGYRDAKLRTLVDTLPGLVDGAGTALDLRWRESDGDEHRAGAVILVSNNRYRMGQALGSGTRARIDTGVLGVTVFDAPPGYSDRWRRRPWRQWTAASFRVDARAAVPTGVDGEALHLQPPLQFRIRPAALRCRVARSHPGASPSAFQPDGAWPTVRALAGIATGHDPRPVPGGAPPPPTSVRRSGP
ncbi:MAG: diacylglycerol kinase catalytic region [Solirubrobacterales bacterium]|nr:diacylglycerol kinase catalytic region [Solirubrobacterales bacterium]